VNASEPVDCHPGASLLVCLRRLRAEDLQNARLEDPVPVLFVHAVVPRDRESPDDGRNRWMVGHERGRAILLAQLGNAGSRDVGALNEANLAVIAIAVTTTKQDDLIQVEIGAGNCTGHFYAILSEAP
jgi:hypothetical protein